MPRTYPAKMTDRKFYAGPTLFDVAKAPYRLGWAFLLAWVFCVFYLQVFGISAGDALVCSGEASAGLALFFDSFPVLVSVATLMTVIASEDKLGSPSAHIRVEIASPIIAAIGTPLLLLDAGSIGATAFVFGMASLLTGIGSGIMWISWGEHYARIPQEDVELFAPVSAVLSALLTLAVSSMSGWVSAAVVTSFPLLSGLCLFIARKEDEPRDANPRPVAKERKGRNPHVLAIPSSMGRTVAGILVACLFVCVAGALVERRSVFGDSGIQIALVASIAFTLAIAFASVVGPRRISISFFYRWMCPALVLGFAAIILFGEQTGSYLAFTMSVAARFAFCLITQMYFARVASEGRLSAVQAYGWGWVSVHLGDFLGVLATAWFAEMIADGAVSLDQVAAASMVALVTATMFVIDDKRSFSSSRQDEQSILAGKSAAMSETPPPCGSATPLRGETPPKSAADKRDAPRPDGDDTQSGNPDDPGCSSEEGKAARGRSLEERIDEIAAQNGLTPRECEVFTLLAQGRSVPYVRDALVISRETAATHAKHIYAKLGVHSRQELIDLVAGARSS